MVPLASNCSHCYHAKLFTGAETTEVVAPSHGAGTEGTGLPGLSQVAAIAGALNRALREQNTGHKTSDQGATR